MGKLSQLGALNNRIENNKKLRFAKYKLSKEQYEKLYKSYKKLFWFQIAPVILFVIAVILILIFIPSQDVPNGYADMKTTILLFGTAFFVALFFPIWLVISQFVVGKLWHKYFKWYKSEESMDKLYDLFE